MACDYGRGLRGSSCTTGGHKCHNLWPCEYAEYMCIFQILRNMVLNADPGYIASWAAAMIASWDF